MTAPQTELLPTMTSTAVLRSSPVDHSYLAVRTFPSSYDGSTAPHCTQRTDVAKRLLYTTRHLNLTLAFTGREHTTKRQETHQHRTATRHCDLSELPYVMQSNSFEPISSESAAWAWVLQANIYYVYNAQG